MSVTALKTSYHHGDLRQVLMTAACEHIARDGTEKLSLRALAREAGVSPTAPYRHFPTKNCLLAAIAAEGFAELIERIQRYSSETQPDAVAQMAASARAYVRYALDNPIKFHLMFGAVVADFSPYQELQNNAAAAFDAVVARVRNAKEAGLLRQADIEEVVAYIWAGMHGMASLILDKTRRLEEQDQSSSMQSVRYMRDNLDAMVQRFIDGILR